MTKPARERPVVPEWAAVGARIRDAMVAAGMNNKQLATATGIDTATISYVLNGKQRATLDNLQKIAVALGVSRTSTFLDGAEAGTTTDEEKLTEWLTRNATKLGITAQERYYLLNSRFHTDPWVTRDDNFWEKALAFVRNVIRDEQGPGRG